MPRARYVEPIVVLLFFFSGVAGLSLEVLWLRQLSLFFGATVQATAVVLAAFMLGLALGSYFGGRFADRVGVRPLSLYGVAEIGIGIFAVLLPFGFELADKIVGAADRNSFFPLGVRVVLGFMLLLPPTILMGATFPLVCRWLELGGGVLSRAAGLLYGVNTAGAVLGTVICALWWIPDLGIDRASLVVLLIDGVVGLIALRISRDRVTVSTAPEGSATPCSRGLILLAAITGFTALALQVIGTRVLTLFVGTTVYAFAAMLATYLVGISIGSWIALPFLGRGRAFCLRAAGLAQLLAACALLGACALVNYIPDLYLGYFAHSGLRPPHPFSLGLVVAPTLLLLPATLGGACFPLLISAARGDRSRSGRTVGALYAANTVGAVLGSLAAGFALVPGLGLRASLILLATVGVGACGGGLALLLAGEDGARRLRRSLGLAAVGLPAFALPFLPLWDPLRLSAGAYWNPRGYVVERASGERISQLRAVLFERESLHHSEGLGATVDVFEAVDGGRHLAINGKIVASTQFLDMRLQLTMGSLGPLLHPNPRDMLIIGLGTGVTSGAAAAHPAVRHLTVVELTPGVAAAADWFARWNDNLLRSPKLELIFDDGANFVRHTGRRFDVISSDPIDPFTAGSATLYSIEHFAASRGKLAPGGIFCQWLPLYQLSEHDFATVLRTFVEVFPEASLWFTGTDCVLVGADCSLAPPRLADAFRAPALHGMLAPYGLDCPERVVATWFAGGASLRASAARGEINSVDRPILEYSAPLAVPQSRIAENLAALLPARVRAPHAIAAGLDMAIYDECSDLVLEAVADRDSARALESLRRAMKLDPLDALPRYLYLERLATSGIADRGELEAALPIARSLLPVAPLRQYWKMLALSLANAGDIESARVLLREIQWHHPRLHWPAATEARCLLGAGRAEEAWQLIEARSKCGGAYGYDLQCVRYLAASTTGRDDVASAMREELLAVTPRNENPDYDAARLCLAAGRVAEAQAAALRAARFRMKDPLPRALLAAIALGIGDAEGARRVIEEALAEHPTSPAMLNVDGERRQLEGDFAGAANSYEMALKHDPRMLAAWRNLAAARRALGDEAAALRALESANDLRHEQQ